MTEKVDHQLHAIIREERAAHLPNLPSPSLLWWRAQLMERRRLQTKALRPIVILRGVSTAAIYTCVAALGYAPIHSAHLNLAAVVTGGALFAATHVGALSIYWSLSAKAK